MEPLYLRSFRGGINVTDPPSSIPNDQTVVAENLDFDNAFLGAKRRGSSLLTFSGLNLSGGDAGLTAIVGLHRFLPTDDAGDAQLVIEAISPSGAYGEGGVVNFYFALEPEGWTTLYAANVIENKPAHTQNLHGKLFMTIPHANVSGGSIDDRLYVYDPDTTGLTILESGVGTTTFSAIRKVGVWEPDAPSVADEGSGSFTTTRYYRVRGVIQVDGVTKYRSEPSESTSFTPSGTGAGARITRPAFMEGTHWEVEESLDDVLFYRITTVVITTSTYDDELAALDVATTGTLSEDIGDYTVPYAPAYVAADENRLLLGGALYQDALRSRVSWTPVGAASGVGNDERLEEDTDPFVDLDGYDGGPITGVAGPINGFMWALKDSHIYKLVRTGSRQQSYVAVPVTKVNGAVPNSLVSGLDQSGNAALFFLDPRIGPMLIGTNGLKTMGEDIRIGLWSTFNPSADFPAHGLFYSEQQQVWWWIATGDAEQPDLKIVVDVKEFTEDRHGYRKGWGTHTGAIQECMCSTLFADNLRTAVSGEAYSSKLKPYFGTINPIGAVGEVSYKQVLGSYTGNGTSQSITTVGFQPKVVIVLPYNPTASIGAGERGGAFKTDVMAATESYVRAASPASITTGITGFTGSGFTVGAHDSVNKSGITYSYIAIYDKNDTYCKTGTYVGIGGTPQDIEIDAGGFTAETIWVFGTGTGASAGGVVKTSAMPANQAVKLNATATVLNLITAITATGFTVGSETATNALGATFFYVAWQDTADLDAMVQVGSFAGTGSGQSVTGVGFQPDEVWGLTSGAFGSGGKTTDMASADSARFADGVIRTQMVTSIDADGFTVGTEFSQIGVTTYWMAFTSGQIGAVVGALEGGTFEADVADLYDDNGTAYESRVRSKQFILGGILRRFGVNSAGILVTPVSGESLTVSLIRDYGKETLSKSISLTPTADEADADYILRQIDNLSMSDLLSLQMEITDNSGTFAWAVDQFVLKMTDLEST